MEKQQVVLSLSGGMDSSTLLLHLLASGFDVTALSFDYGQKHKVELKKAKSLIRYLEKKGHPVKHQVIKLKGLTKLLNSNLVEGGDEVPEGHYEQENMKQTVVPNRNKIFSSILQAVALSQSTRTNSKVLIAMGLHAGDFEVYPDCRKAFRDADYEAFQIGNWSAENVTYYIPYLDVTKYEILQDGLSSCEKLNLDFDRIYQKTNTSYKPIQIGNKWYSDYKSAASVERIEAFLKLGRKDPVAYANPEEGPVTWDKVSSHVKQILEEWENK